MGITVFTLVAVLGILVGLKLARGSSDPGLPPTGAGLPVGTMATLKLPGGAKMEMAWCPPGRFMMGSPENEEGRYSTESLYSVTLSEGFWMAKFPVTQKQWKSVMWGNPSHFKGNSLPVEHVRWFDCMKFCRKAGLSLPTEAQWEYACRAGSTGAYAGTGDLSSMGWHCEVNDCRSTHPVGQKAPNAWGLYDMHGNVWEWCLDVWNAKEPSGVPFDPQSAKPHAKCAIRGGSIWAIEKESCRSASRGSEDPNFHEDPYGAPIRLIGFRPVVRQYGGPWTMSELHHSRSAGHVGLLTDNKPI